MLILGAHMSIAGGFAQAAKRAGEEYHANAMQIFTKSPRSRHARKLDPEDVRDFKNYCEKYRISYVVAHSSYLLNFAKPISEVTWAVNDITSDFERLSVLGGTGVIIHVGKSVKTGIEDALRNVAENAKIIIEKTEKSGLQYIIENTAGQSGEIGYNLEQLSHVWKQLKGFSPRIKFCLDTCHLWGAGYNLSDDESRKKLFHEFDQLIGLDQISCFHLNNSKYLCASHMDRHEHLQTGQIKPEAMLDIAKQAAKYSIGLIVETPEKGGLTRLDDLVFIRSGFEN